MPDTAQSRNKIQSTGSKITSGKRTAEQAFSLKDSSTEKLRPFQQRRGDDVRSNKIVTFKDNQATENGVVQSNSTIRSRSNTVPQKEGRLRHKASELLKTRQQLPIWSHAGEIRNKVQTHDVLLLVGETGSGKSTQIPQFLLPLCKQKVIKGGSKVGGRIAITQPRRVAAISLAKRVAEEMGTPLGKSSPASQVGYSVRFDNSTSPSTKVKFVTDGMLLQELLKDPWLKEYSVVVVDEVHERGVNVDLVLGFLKQMIDNRNKDDGRGGVPLKVVVMSATTDMDKLQVFFEGTAVGMIQNGTAHNDDSDNAQNGESDLADSQKYTSPPSNSAVSAAKVASCYIKGRQYPVKKHYTAIPTPNVLDAAFERITMIHTHEPLPGDILVFLPGQESINTLESMCINYAQSLMAKSKEKGQPRLPKLLILPLFAALPTTLQQRVFEPTPPFTRKIILSTNIAETSVTVPGIRHVIDTGKRKVRFFRPGLNLETLLTKPISRSSANQRAGRAGREAAGNCYRLYTEQAFYNLEADTEPEVLRCDLSQLVLILKSHNVINPFSFPLLTPLPQKSLERAHLYLLELKALKRQNGQLTKLGRQMSTLPLPANLARILLASQSPHNNCLEEIIDIVSGLSVENIWLPIHNTRVAPKSQTSLLDQNSTNNPNTQTEQSDSDEESQDPIAKARSTLYRREGDHLTLLAAIQGYVTENTDRKEWCSRHGISHRAMKAAMEVRKQLRNLLIESTRYNRDSNGTPTNPKPQPPKSSADVTTTLSITTNGANDVNSERSTDQDLSTRILRTLLLGLGDKTAYLSPQTGSASKEAKDNNKANIWVGPYATFSMKSRNFQVHPSSVLFSRAGPGASTRPPYIMFSEFVVTERAYVRCVSAVEGAWLDEDGEDDGSDDDEK